ncbi:GtrA family protein [Ruminococcaceae bacterium OttesenSCG-928-L11]|nr:GtrA family protein [Ruminococcaceae bacterium OttesenSCG-928-L11]
MIDQLRALYRKHRGIVLYLVFGGLTTVVNYAVYWLLTRIIPLPMVAANLLAWAAAVAFAYVTNRRYVFESAVQGAAAILREAGSFVAARVFSGLLDTALMVVLVQWLHINDMLAKLAISVLVIIVNYILSKWLVFRKKKA